MYKILIVDDEETLRAGLGEYLTLEGYHVDTAASAEEAMKLDLPSYSAVLLDIMMDGMSGIEMAAAMKRDEATANVPVIFLTAKDGDEDMIEGLKVGADDYIAKPYSVRIVMARIEAVLRRTAPKAVPGVVCDRKSLECLIDGEVVRLPRKEFELLSLLTANPGRIFTREELMSRVWNESSPTAERSVDVHITRLRGHIAPYGQHIVTRSGYGYGWQD